MFCPTYNVRDLSTFEVKLWCLVGQCIKYFFDSRFSTYQGFIGMSPCHKSREEDLYVHVSSSEAKVTLVCFKIEVLESTLKSLVVARSLILCHTSSSGSDYQVVTQADNGGISRDSSDRCVKSIKYNYSPVHLECNF